MIPYRLFINDVEGYPLDREALTFSVDFVGNDENNDGIQVSTSRLRFANEMRDEILRSVDQLGYFEGIPVYIIIDSVTFEFFIDVQDNFKRTETYVECSIKKRYGLDTFKRNASSTTFELLNFKGLITSADMIEVPYLIIRDDQPLTLLLLSITTYNVTKALIEQVMETAKSISKLTALLAPDFNAGGPVIKLGAIIEQALRVLFMIAYTIALIIALKALIEQICEIIFPKLRYLKAMKLKRLIEIGCQYLGYTLKSSLLDAEFGLTFLPVPHQSRQKNIWEYLQSSLPESFNKGYPTDLDAFQTVQGAIEFVEAFFHVKSRPIGNVLYIEEEEYFQNLAATTIANNFNNQSENENEYSFDFSRITKRGGFVYARDVMDLNTFDKIKGGGYEVTTEAVNFQNKDLSNIKGENIVNLNVSLGARKNDYTFQEKQVLKLAKIFDKITNSNTSGKFANNRLGVLVVSQQFFANSKLLWLVGNKQPSNFTDFLGAGKVYNKYHSKYLLQIGMLRLQMPIQFTGEMLLQILNNNYVPLETGGVPEILGLDYTPWTATAVVDERINIIATNLKILPVYED